MTEIKGYKGFDKDFKCRDFNFEVGKTYEEPDAKICGKGFHFCEIPFDVFAYYPPADSRYGAVCGSGKTVTDSDDSKIACTILNITKEISLTELISDGVNYILSAQDEITATNTGNYSATTNTGDWSATTNTGDWSAATNTGDRSAATNTGYRSATTNTGDRSAATNTGYRSATTNTGNQSAATNTGFRSAAEVSGNDSIACGLGIDNKVRGAIGCCLVLADWSDDNKLTGVKTAMVDGEIIKADVWYRLKKGEFTEVN